MSRHREPAVLRAETVIVDTRLRMIYRISGETLALIPKKEGKE